MTVTRDAIVRPGFAVCAVERIVLLVWKDTPSAAGVDALKAVFEQVRTGRSPARLGFVTLIEANAGASISPEVRDYLTQVIKEIEPEIRAAVVVYESTGFKATIVRSVITAINMINRPKYWFSVYAERGPAVEQLVQRMAGETYGDTRFFLSALSELSQQIQKASVRAVQPIS